MRLTNDIKSKSFIKTITEQTLILSVHLNAWRSILIQDKYSLVSSTQFLVDPKL